MCNRLSLETTSFLHRCFAGRSSFDTLRKWVIESEELEQVLTGEDYLSVIALDFRHKYTINEVEKLLNPYIDWSSFTKWQLHNTLNSVAHRNKDALEALAEIYDLYCLGFRFLQDLALGFGLEATAPRFCNYKSLPELTKSEREQLRTNLFPKASKPALRVMDWLEQGKIEFVVTERDEVKYRDLRDEHDKKLRHISVVSEHDIR